jgi:hypothetical protein
MERGRILLFASSDAMKYVAVKSALKDAKSSFLGYFSGTSSHILSPSLLASKFNQILNQCVVPVILNPMPL